MTALETASRFTRETIETRFETEAKPINLVARRRDSRQLFLFFFFLRSEGEDLVARELAGRERATVLRFVVVPFGREISRVPLSSAVIRRRFDASCRLHRCIHSVLDR